MKPHLQNQNIQVMLSLNFGLPQTVADPHQLEQVFVNLITNAIQALTNISEPRQLTIESRQVKDTICLASPIMGPICLLTDMPIFSITFSIPSSAPNKLAGTGLGLSICFGIISEHRGRIWVETSPKGGASFYIELPIVSVQESLPTPASPTSLPFILKPPHTHLHILAVDDEPPLLNLLCRVLEKLGHTVETAPNGETALQKLTSKTYDLIICDILMPDILGPDLYRQTVEKSPELANHFIFITGNVVDIDTRVFLEKSGLPWLPKPFLPIDVEKAVARATAKIKTSTTSSEASLPIR